MTWIETLECDSCAKPATSKDYDVGPVSRARQLEDMYELDGCAFLITNPGPSADVFPLTKKEAIALAHGTVCAHVCADCMNNLPVKLFNKTEIPEGAGRADRGVG